MTYPIEYIEPAAARQLDGLRLALTAGVPAPYSMSARAILEYHQVPYTAVRQVGAGSNETLLEWTRHRNAPVAVYNDEAPRTGWLEILHLAERLGSSPSLFPQDNAMRREMVGWIDQLIGENGWVWNMRLLMLGFGGPERAAKEAARNPMYADYGYSADSHAQAIQVALAQLREFSAWSESLETGPAGYFFGDQLCALDIYWVYFSQLLQTLPLEVCPIPDMLRTAYDSGGQALGEGFDELLARRNWMVAQYPALPFSS